MKEFLFSRSHKKHYSSAVVRMGKNNLGFSLVELIIVIAIMAILIAVAIPALGVFIQRSKINSDKSMVSDVIYAIHVASESRQYKVDVQQATTDGSGLQIPVAFVVLSKTDADGIKIIATASDSDNAGVKYNEQVLNQMLKDTLGEKAYSELHIESDSWGNKNAIPDLYAETSTVFEKVQTMSSMLANLDSVLNYVLEKTGKGTMGEYENGVEAVSSIAGMVKNSHPDVMSFEAQWTAKRTSANTGFGLSDREAYMATRLGYNEAVSNFIMSYGNVEGHDVSSHASYVAECGSSMKVPASMSLKDLGKWALGYGQDVTIPAEIRPDLFANDSENSLNDSVQNCTICKQLVQEYDGSASEYVYTTSENARAIAKADAQAFYNVMVTLDATKEGALEYADGKSGNAIWGYYEDIVSRFSNTYTELQTYVETLDSCIVISIYLDENDNIYGECNTPGVLDE